MFTRGGARGNKEGSSMRVRWGYSWERLQYRGRTQGRNLATLMPRKKKGRDGICTERRGGLGGGAPERREGYLSRRTGVGP